MRRTLCGARPPALLAVLSTTLLVLFASGTGAQDDATDGLTEEEIRELERITTLGYVAGGDAAPDAGGVTIREPGAFDGYTLYVSADYPGAFLVDMDGAVVHSWHEEGPDYWVRAHACPDGGVIAISAYPFRLARFTRDSELIWEYGEKFLRAHHDFQVQPDGRIYVLMRRPRNPAWLGVGGISEDMICVVEPDGSTVRQVDCVSIAEAFRDSEFAHLLDDFGVGIDDPFHANSVEVLGGSVPHPAFADGNVLVSIRNMDCLAVVDMESRNVVWTSCDRWQRQHEARVTPGGRIMLFDNRKFDGRSRVVEFEVASGDITWEYTAGGFYSPGASAQQLLPNGNVLITESQKGRILEVTRDGEIVWEYLNPRRLEDEGTIVRIPRASRVAPDFFDRGSLDSVMP
jgi:hypothetical protein